MKAERWIFALLAGFFSLMAVIYYLMAREIAGATALLLAGLLAAMVAAYLAVIARKIDPRPEDNPHGEIVDGAGALGFFPPSSIWPFWVALSITVILLGPVFGWWISVLGIGIGVWATCGLVFQYYRGNYRH